MSSKEQFFYIQNGYVGNSMLWWAKNSRGYTIDITKAERYTLQQIKLNITRDSDIAWPCDYIDGNEQAKVIAINSHYLDHSKKIKIP